MRRFALATAVFFSVAAIAPAMADDDGYKTRLNVPREKWLSPSEIGDRLVAQGYRVREIESDDGAYEVKVTDKNGARIEMHVHPETGALLPGYDD